MSEDEFRLRTPIFSFGVSKKEHQIILKEGETVIIRSWSWKKFGYIRKAITILGNKVQVEIV